MLLGVAALVTTRVIVNEPDRGAGFMNFAPRVMLNQADVDATGLVQPASRLTYRLALAAPEGGDAVVGRFVAWAQALLATAIGLFAAIPAVLAYNRFSYDIDRLAVRFESFMEEFTNIMQRQG